MDFHSMLSNFKRDAEAASHHSKGNNSNKKPRLSTRDNEEERKRFLSKVPVKTVYLICPPNVQTGGPEAMHQLCHVINTNFPNSGVQAFMVYVQVEPSVRIIRRQSSCRVEAYDIYNAPFLPSHLPTYSSTELFIWPECWTNHMDYLFTGTDYQMAIWWLSVNNNNNKFHQWHTRGDILHLYQSEYAKQHILKNLTNNNKNNNNNKTGVDKQMIRMTEYIPNRSTEQPHQKRDLQVLYNPLKGMHFTHEIIKRCGNAIQFTPIGGGPDGRERISPQKVRELLHRAEVYIDFGPHPGMDRLPREAALAQCIVITNQLGAANYKEDVPIPPQYKVQDVQNVPKLLTTSLKEYETKKKDFDSYREWINGQENQMHKCVQNFLQIINDNRQNDEDNTKKLP